MRKTLGEKSDLTPEGEDRQKNESNSSREQKKMSPVLSPHLIKKKKIIRRRSKQNARETETDYPGKHSADLQDPDSPKQTATFSNYKHRCDLKKCASVLGQSNDLRTCCELCTSSLCRSNMVVREKGLSSKV